MKKENFPTTPSFVFDRLYGSLEFDEKELRLFQTKELARLRHVSLSAIPTWTIPTGVCASKFEHSLGVTHLAKIVGKKKEFNEIANDLYFAALAHDMGTPPFSHASEYFQIKILGKNHEEFAENVIDGSEFAKVVKESGGKIDKVIGFVLGREKPFSDIVNGSIDIDNLDNSLRFGLSMGLFKDIFYSPEKLADAYTFSNGEVSLHEGFDEEILAWEKTRRLVYDFVYSEANLASGMALFRALDFAAREGELKENYFLMTDEEAFDYLLNSCNQRTRKMADRINRWVFYPRVYNHVTDLLPDQTQKPTFIDSDFRGKIADDISKELKIDPEDVCVYTGRNKGFKQIHLPIIGEGNTKRNHKPANKLTYMAQVYLHPKHVNKAEEVKEMMEDILRV